MTTALFIQRGPARLSTAMVLSVLIHALLLSVSLGGHAFGLPGLNLPWKERRLGADDLRILLAPALPNAPASSTAPVPAAEPVSVPAQPSPAETTDSVLAKVNKPTVVPSITPLTTPPPPAVVRSPAAAVFAPPPLTPVEPAPLPAMPEIKRADVNLPIAPEAPKVRAPTSVDAPATSTQSSEEAARIIANDAAQKQLEQRALQRTLEQEQQVSEKLRQAELTANAERETARQELLRQEAARAEQTAKTEAARLEAERQELVRQDVLRREALRQAQARQDEKAQQDAARQELERAEAARMDAVRRETIRQEQIKQAQLEATRLAQAKQEAARLEAARREATQQEQARQAQLEADRQAQARLEAARRDALNQEAARRDAAKQEAARQDAIKQDAVRQAQTAQQAAQQERAEQEAKREERLRAIGDQMKAEAAKRDAVNPPSSMQQPTVSSLRRGWLYGRADTNKDLVLYADAMSKKIEMNMTFEIVREVVKQPHARPTVTVAIRADGSVEKVTFVVSSGVPAIDDAIRKVVASQASYGAFSPGLARQYDVIEIRRTWIFDTAIRLQ